MIVFHSSNRRSLNLGNGPGNVAQRAHGFDCGCSRRVLYSSFLNCGRPSPFTQPVLQYYNSTHLAQWHKHTPALLLRAHVNIRSAPRLRGRSRSDGRSAPSFCCFIHHNPISFFTSQLRFREEGYSHTIAQALESQMEELIQKVRSCLPRCLHLLLSVIQRYQEWRYVHQVW